MARVTYSDAATSGTSQAIQVDTNQAVGDDGDRVIKKIFVGKPVAGATLTIFNINKNDYRLIAEINYSKGWLFIKFIGTHSEYDKINPSTVDQYKSKTK